MSSESDRLLIQAIRDGDPDAWRTLIGRYEGRLLAFARHRLHDRSSSEDVVQETFVGFLTSLPNFDDRRELQTYLFTICAHKITDHLRRSSRRPPPGGEDSDEILSHQVDRELRTASSDARTRERVALESAAIVRSLGQMLRQWQADCEFLRLKVLELLFVRGLPNREVAKVLGIGEQQVANVRFAALRKLAERLRDSGLNSDVFPELQEGT